MNALACIPSLWFVLVLLTPTSAAQAPHPAITLSEAIETTGDTTEVRALLKWAEKYRETNPDQAESIVERALTLARQLNDQQGIGKGLMLLGHVLFASDIHQAEAYYRTARDVFEQIGDEHGLNQSRLAMGNVYGRRGDLEQALIHYFNALEGFERLNDVSGRVGVLTAIAITHTNQGNPEEALSYFEQSAILVDSLDEPLIITTLLNLGGALAEEGSYERAETILYRALTISDEHELPLYTAGVSNNLGHLFNLQGQHERALPHLFTAERLAQELGEDAILAAVYDEIAKAYIGLEYYDRALYYAEEGLALARESGLKFSQILIHQTLYRIYEMIRDHEQALFHYQKYVAARDSILSVQRTEIIAEMQARYETEEKLRAIEQLEQQNQIHALQRTLLLIGVGSLLLLLGFLYSRYRAKQKTNRLLEELDNAKSRFFANISHEFRTPLTVILGGLQDTISGRLGSVSEKVADQQHVMLHNTHRLQGLIDEVLDLNRLEAGQLELRPAPGDLVRSLKHIVQANAPLAERNGITLTLACDVESCPRLYDEAKLEKIVGNLLSNALKFTSRGGSVRVNLRCENQVEISVTDDGSGIPDEAQRAIFERFKQLDHGVLKGGTGIGLALAKELTELHSGTITLESAPGKGSTFTVRLPLEITEIPLSGMVAQQPNENQVQPVGISPNDGLVAQETNGHIDQTTILIIEDNDDVRSYVRRSLEETYRVLEAINGESGLRQARESLPDLIVTDVMLPDIDGYEIARRLKTVSDTECIPLIMLTARAAEGDHVTGYDSGAEAYITKPFSPETLSAAIARLLEERRRLRRRLHERFREAPIPSAKREITPRSPLEEQLRAIVKTHIADSDFNAEALAGEAALSYKQLYRRLRNELDVTPSQFIRRVRIEVAAELLIEEVGTISEVAYAVGFNSLSYFNRNFRERFGMAPSDYITATA